jgi:hypothetical protein
MIISNRTRTRLPLSLLAGVALAAASLGCGTMVRGVIRDKPTGNPISSATVSIGKSNATTNAIGAYELKTDIESSSILLINAPGYFLYSASVGKRSDEDDELVRDVELVPRSQMSNRQ